MFAGCSTAGEGAADAVVSPALGSPTASAPQQVAVDRIAKSAASRLSLAVKLAQAKYQENAPLDDPGGEDSAEAAFVAQAVKRGVPTDVARQTINAVLGESKAIEVRLNMEWATGVAPSPTTAAPSLKTTLAPEARTANAALADAMGDLAAVGFPTGWPAPLDAAAVVAAADLAPGVEQRELDIVLAPVKAWQPPAPPKRKKKAKNGKK